MLEMKFQEFFNGNYEDNDDHEIYVLTSDREILYIGISKANIWNRWFGNFGRMWKDEDGKFQYSDLVSKEVVDNFPDSLAWSIQLLSTKECIEICKDELKKTTYLKNRLVNRPDVLERYMIHKFHPVLNLTHNA